MSKKISKNQLIFISLAVLALLIGIQLKELYNLNILEKRGIPIQATITFVGSRKGGTSVEYSFNGQTYKDGTQIPSTVRKEYRISDEKIISWIIDPQKPDRATYIDINYTRKRLYTTIGLSIFSFALIIFLTATKQKNGRVRLV